MRFRFDLQTQRPIMAPVAKPKNLPRDDGIVRSLQNPQRLSEAAREQQKVCARRRGRGLWLDERDKILSA